MAIVVGIDVGTSGLKAIALEASTGSLLASAHRAYALDTPRPGWAEQDPEALIDAANQALCEIAGALGPRAIGVRAIGITGQMHSAVLLDDRREVIRPAILWCDTRTTAQCDAIRAAMGEEGLARAVGPSSSG
jgi:xylulokinase